ncbi:hypothetical protein QBC37DRAFT_292794, partial [Rhypophila decipiens]
SFEEDDKRPAVIVYVERPKFSVNAKVYWKKAGGVREGPYRIAAPPAADKCVLATDDGTPVNGGAAIDLKDVEAA